ncbi:MAG TPA: ion transporter [Longimicrobiales bacterium]|nr:ion transporter [Longimicrobiales bacterium]
MTDLRPGPDASAARKRTYEVIFEHDSAAGRIFDVGLILAILASVGAVVLESVAQVRLDHGPLLRRVEWGFTVLFTVEYLLRLWCVSRPARYARSFFGVVDLLAVLPTYLAALLPGGQVLVTVRILRILRVFRILKLGQYVGEARLLGTALRASRIKITVFLLTVVTLVVILGSVIYLVESRHPESGFTSIPISMYWAVVTLTTVGYGDVAPVTPLGQTLAAMIMVVGYGIIAVPTGIVSVELAQAARKIDEEDRARAASEGGAGVVLPPPDLLRPCPDCGLDRHDPDAHFCKRCGVLLPLGVSPP